MNVYCTSISQITFCSPLAAWRYSFTHSILYIYMSASLAYSLQSSSVFIVFPSSLDTVSKGSGNSSIYLEPSNLAASDRSSKNSCTHTNTWQCWNLFPRKLVLWYDCMHEHQWLLLLPNTSRIKPKTTPIAPHKNQGYVWISKPSN